MEPFVLVPVLAAVGLVLVVVALVAAHLRERDRQARFDQEAHRLGLDLRRRDPTVVALYRPLKGFPPSSDGHIVHETFTGTHQGRRVTLVNCTGLTQSRDSKGHTTTQRHPVAFAIAHLPVRLPRVTIQPETWAHKVADALGAEDVDLESDEFNRRFWVKSPDRRFAYDLLHPRLMQYLLDGGKESWEVQGDLAVTWRRGHLQPEDLEPALRRLDGFLRLVPANLLAPLPEGRA